MATHYSEIILQGVRCLNGMKLGLSHAYNVIFGYNDTGKTSLLDAMLSLLSNDHYTAQAGSLLPWNPGGPSRGGLTIRTSMSHLRAIKNFADGSMTCTQYTEATQNWETIATNASEFERILVEGHGFPEYDDYRRVYVTTLFDLPSMGGGTPRGGGGGAAAGAGGVSAFFGDNAGEMGEEERNEKMKQRIEQIDKALTDLEELKQLDFEIADLEDQKFRAEEGVGKVGEVDKRILELEKTLEVNSRYGEVSQEVRSKVENYDDMKAEKHQREIDWAEERFQIESKLRKRAYIKPFFKDALFYVGVVILIGGVYAGSQVPALFPILFVGVALGGWRLWKGLKEAGITQELRDKLAKREKEVEQKARHFEVSTSLVEQLMTAFDARDAEGLMEKFAKYDALVDELKETKAKRKELDEEIGFDESSKKAEELEETLKEIRARQQKFSGMNFEPNKLRAEKRQLEQAMGLEPSDTGEDEELQGTAVTFAAVVPGAGAGAAGGSGDALADLCEAALSISGMDAMQFYNGVNSKFGAYLGPLSTYSMPGANIDANGVIMVDNKHSPRSFSPAELAPLARDVVYVALKFAIYETLLANKPFPVIFDSPFIHFDEQRQVALAKAIKRLSSAAQVIHLTGKQEYTKLADQSYSLQ